MDLTTISWIANIILTLLLLFQWDRKYASEQTIKFHTLAIRRMISRLGGPEASNIVDSLDATLATLDARSPFIEWGRKILSRIKQKFKKDSESPLLNIEEQSSDIQT